MTPERNTLANIFLTDADWGAADRANLAGDASMRRYERLLDPQTGKTAILMDAPPETNGDVTKFVRIAHHLTDIGLSAPQVLGTDVKNGFLLLEDLGDGLFARAIPAAPHLEHPLYEAATEVLVALHNADTLPLTNFGPALMAEQASLVFETWVQPLSRQTGVGDADRFADRFADVLRLTTQSTQVMILRDYHAENLLWLPNRSGVARVGLLDFQDAMLSHPAYDLVSLLQDVRRDVSPTIELAMVTHYINKTGQNDHAFRTAYAVLGVQRNLRILAVFARLATSLGKPFYATLIPRTWNHLMRGLERPALAPIASMLIDALPPPTPANLQKLVPS